MLKVGSYFPNIKTHLKSEIFFLNFAEASPATLALHCLEKSGRLLAAKDNPRQVLKSVISALCILYFFLTLMCKTFAENCDSKAPSVGTLLAYLETAA